MYMYIYMYIYVYMCVCIYIYVCMCVCVFVCATWLLHGQLWAIFREQPHLPDLNYIRLCQFLT